MPCALDHSTITLHIMLYYSKTHKINHVAPFNDEELHRHNCAAAPVKLSHLTIATVQQHLSDCPISPSQLCNSTHKVNCPISPSQLCSSTCLTGEELHHHNCAAAPVRLSHLTITTVQQHLSNVPSHRHLSNCPIAWHVAWHWGKILTIFRERNCCEDARCHL